MVYLRAKRFRAALDSAGFFGFDIRDLKRQCLLPDLGSLPESWNHSPKNQGDKFSNILDFPFAGLSLKVYLGEGYMLIFEQTQRLNT